MASGRVREQDVVIPSLRSASERPDGFISTSELIAELSEIFNSTGRDTQILEGRNDTHFSQKVRKLILHRDSSTSFIRNGYAEYTGDGIRITHKGRHRLEQLASTNE